MMKKIMLWPRKWIAIMAGLIVAAPLGILVVWNSGDAWGEWGAVGDWVPQQFWNAPFAGYDLSGWEGQFMASMGYIISAIVGIVAIIVLTYVLYVVVSKRENRELSK
jgi:cobalt/nickel transport protein